MKLADEITIRLDDGEILHCRPTLRAAARLERRYGGFDAIVRGIADCSVTVISDLINETADRRTAFADFLRHIEQSHLQGAQVLIEPLITLTLALAGVDEEKADEPQAATQPITFAEHHTKLFRLATGWLGWTPSQAWDATPAEIVEAYRGRIDMLSSIFGGADQQSETRELTSDEFKAFVAGGGNLGC